MRDKFLYLQKKYLSRQNIFFNYAATLFELTIESTLLIIITIALNALLLYLTKMFWYTYKATPVGQMFIKQFGNKYQFFVEILSRDLVSVSVNLTLGSFIICLIISVGCQLLYVARLFHYAKSFVHKLIYCGFPLAGLVSYYFYFWPMYPTRHWSYAYILYCLSTLCNFNLCFKISNKLIPELGAIIKAVYRAIQVIADWQLPKKILNR